MYSTPVVDEDGAIYTVSGGAARAFDLETGEVKWEFPFTPNRIHATPALAEGRLFVGTGAGTLHALDAKSGGEVWRWDTTGDGALFTPYVRKGEVTLTSPVVAGGCVYIGAANGFLYALNTATGNCVWQYNLKVPLAAPPAISGNGLWIGGVRRVYLCFFIKRKLSAPVTFPQEKLVCLSVGICQSRPIGQGTRRVEKRNASSRLPVWRGTAFPSTRRR